MNSDTAQDRIISLWEAQQDVYVAHRAQRFGIVLDTIAATRPEPQTILDIGGGLGSFSKLLLERFPETTVITLDYDPALLRLAAHNLRTFTERSVLVDADLTAPRWHHALQGALPDVVVSSTALHWLSSSALVGLYETLFDVLAPGGLFFNADHYSHYREGSLFGAASHADDARRQSAFSAELPDWQGWWDEFSTVEGFSALIAERDRRFAMSADIRDATPGLHMEALRVAGFVEAGTLWQHYDNYVVYGVRG